MSSVKRFEVAALARKAALLVAFWGVAAMLMALFWVKDGDIAAARQDVLLEGAASPDNAPPVMPKITRRDFEFKLPIPGEKGKYHWKVGGRESVSVDPSTDRILHFRGEIVDRTGVTNLSSATALFDKEARVLSCQKDVVVQSEWSRIEAPEMVMQMKTDYTKFSGGVTTRIDTEKAPTGEAASPDRPPPPEEEKPAEAAPGSAKKEKKKRSPLVITSKELHLHSKENHAIFIGNVEARDEGGIILADKMDAFNYSQEEKEKDPALKGVKTVICIGNVKIDQVEGKKQALCARAVFDAKTNTVHLYHDPETGKKVVYRDEEQKWQAEAKEMILYRDKNEVRFIGGVKTVDFNPDTKGFLGFMEPEPAKPKKEEPVSGTGKNPQTTPK